MRPLLIVAAAVVIAASVFVYRHQLMSNPGSGISVVTPGGKTPVEKAATPALDTRPVTEGVPAETPSWMKAPAPKPAASAALGATAETSGTTPPTAISPAMTAALAELQRLQAQGVGADLKAIGAALLQVELANGSPVMNGLRLDVLRQNLAVAEKIKVLLADSSLQPGADGALLFPEKMKASDERFVRLQALQKEMRTDIFVTVPAPGVAR